MYKFAKHIHKSEISLDFFLLQLICNLQVVQPLYSFYESIVKCPPPLTSKRRRTFLKMGRYWFLASTGQSFMLSYTDFEVVRSDFVQ